jgi:hypothetical protein
MRHHVTAPPVQLSNDHVAPGRGQQALLEVSNGHFAHVVSEHRAQLAEVG